MIFQLQAGLQKILIECREGAGTVREVMLSTKLNVIRR